MLTKENYFEKVSDVDWSSIPSALIETHEFILEATGNGMDWEKAANISDFIEVLRLQFTAMENFLPKGKRKGVKGSRQKVGREKKERTSGKKEPKERGNKNRGETNAVEMERIDDSVRFIRRYVGLNGKVKTPEQILSFINSLQRAILERKIRKSDPYADQINYIQKKLLEVYENMGATISLQVDSEVLDSFRLIASSQKISPSTTMLKRYVGAQGKSIEKEKASRLLKVMDKNVTAIPKDNPSRERINRARRNLKHYIENASKSEVLRLQSAALNGMAPNDRDDFMRKVSNV